MQVANARLIAASPDLYAALENICQMWMEENPGAMVAPIYRGLAALAKTRGNK